ncbi:DUF3943 domain-containing protein, partial [bacterium]|nr:DUF3943 domain-containing protein [bacterium]
NSVFFSVRSEYQFETSENYSLRMTIPAYIVTNNWTYASLLTTDIKEDLHFSDPEISMKIYPEQQLNNTFGRQVADASMLLGGVGIGMMGVLMILPRSVTKWEDDYFEEALHNINRAFTKPPAWDKDDWKMNYVGHPYAGSIYYNLIRSRGGTRFQSFLFNAFVSTGWEYLYEGFAEQPSTQDLVVTPVLGSFVGELSHQATKMMKKNGFNLFEKIVTLVINPAYVVMNGYQAR